MCVYIHIYIYMYIYIYVIYISTHMYITSLSLYIYIYIYIETNLDVGADAGVRANMLRIWYVTTHECQGVCTSHNYTLYHLHGQACAYRIRYALVITYSHVPRSACLRFTGALPFGLARRATSCPILWHSDSSSPQVFLLQEFLSADNVTYFVNTPGVWHASLAALVLCWVQLC